MAFPSRLQRKIDQAHELASMAARDGDKKAAAEYMDQAKVLEQQRREEASDG